MSATPETIVVDVIRNRKTGLFVAVSDDLKGLYAHGRTEAELEQNTKRAIEDILEAKTGIKYEVFVDDGRPVGTGAFAPNRVRYGASAKQAA